MDLNPLDYITGQASVTQGITDWFSLPSVKMGLGGSLIFAGVVIILLHRHSHQVSTFAGHLARSVPLGAIAMM